MRVVKETKDATTLKACGNFSYENIGREEGIGRWDLEPCAEDIGLIQHGFS